MSTPKTPIHAENATASSVRKETNEPMKLVATTISRKPKIRLMTALTLTPRCGEP